jgi:hypothetical protein
MGRLSVQEFSLKTARCQDPESPATGIGVAARARQILPLRHFEAQRGPSKGPVGRLWPHGWSHEVQRQ